MKIEAALVSSAGKKRKNNEDNFYIGGNYREDVSVNEQRVKKQYKEKRALFAVFDGMGGHSNGEIASLIAARIISVYGNAEFDKTYLSYFREASKAVWTRSNNMGTTAAVLYISNGKACIYNVGDSRLYIFRNGILSQLSKDHTRAELMVDMGLLSAEDARTHRDSHILTSYLGMKQVENIYTCEEKLCQNDIFILCSDGLYDMLTDEQICGMMREDVMKTAEDLVENANSMGGKDNVTVMVVKVSKL